MERTKLLIFLFLMMAIYPLFANDWKIRKDQDDVKIYTREVSGFDFLEYRGELTVKSTLEELIGIIKDYSSCHKWIDSCKYCKLMKIESDSVRYLYTYNPAPWPVSDRDSIVKHTFLMDSNKKWAKVLIDGVPDFIPPKDNVVRVSKIDGEWYFEDQLDGTIKVIFRVHNNPGGSLPAWLVNRFAVDQPYKTLLNLKKIIERERK